MNRCLQGGSFKLRVPAQGGVGRRAPLIGFQRQTIQSEVCGVRFFCNDTLAAQRAIISCSLQPRFIHYISAAGRLLHSLRSPLRAVSARRRDQREKLESAAINRINSSWEHRPGRTHQFHYLYWTRAIPFLLITQHSHATPRPKCSELLSVRSPLIQHSACLNFSEQQHN